MHQRDVYVVQCPARIGQRSADDLHIHTDTGCRSLRCHQSHQLGRSGFVFNRDLVLDSVVHTAGKSKQPGRRRDHAAQHVGHRPDGSARNFTHTGLPAGLALNATTGQITGTPSAAGTYNVTIFVTDSLVAVSRSFVWTITALVADNTAPALTITSHTNGQTLSTASVTISGTASDSGRGGNGVSVTVNGQAATGGSATASATASWSRKLTLAQGANTITVQATDSRGNIATQSITLNNSSAPVTSVALTSTVASPQNTGTAITFIANSSGGVAPVQFKFLVQPAGGAAQVVQDWSTATTYTWTPATAGAYTVTLWARSAGVTAEYPVPASPEDTFSRANWPNLGPNWTCLTANEPIIENGFARSSLDEHYYCKWNAHTMAADHCAAFKVGNATYGNGVFVRGSGAGATRDAYRFAASAPGHNSFFIKEVDDAVTAVLAPPTLMNWIPGDEGRVCATGTSTVTITLERKSVGSPNWLQINSVEDSSSPLSGTDVGLYMYGTDATIDDLIFTNVGPVQPSAGDAAQASAQMAYVVAMPSSAPVTSATLTSTAASPQNSGTAITFTATSSGGVAAHSTSSS